MKVVVVTSGKGGSGKTTVCRSLAVAAAHAGHRVALIDLDPQQSTRQWWEEREAESPVMYDSDPPADRLPAYLAAMRSEFDFVFVDTPPRLESWTDNILAVCDLAVIPVRASPDDLRAVRATVKATKDAGCEFVFVLSQTTRSRIVEDARITLAATGRVAPVTVATRVAHPEAAISGLTGGEVGDARAADEVGRLWNYVEEVLTDG